MSPQKSTHIVPYFFPDTWSGVEHCWFMHAINSCANIPGMSESMFLEEKQNANEHKVHHLTESRCTRKKETKNSQLSRPNAGTFFRLCGIFLCFVFTRVFLFLGIPPFNLRFLLGAHRNAGDCGCKLWSAHSFRSTGATSRTTANKIKPVAFASLCPWRVSPLPYKARVWLIAWWYGFGKLWGHQKRWSLPGQIPCAGLEQIIERLDGTLSSKQCQTLPDM